jgi:adenylate kinase family enzyme
MQRVAIIGPGGAGKSTLARKLGDGTGLPVVHLDREHWKPGWVEPPREEWNARVTELAAGDRWIIDGNYGGTMHARIAAADTVIFLDFSRFACLRGVISRRIRYRNTSRPDMTEGNKERLTFQFLKWIWDYPATRRPGIVGMLARAVADGKRVVILHNRGEVERFLAHLDAAAPANPLRFVVTGPPGGGKTWLSQHLGPVLGIQPQRLGQNFWGNVAVRRDPAARQAAVREITGDGSWIVEGNYIQALRLVIPEATVGILIERGLIQSYYRRLRRGYFPTEWTERLRMLPWFVLYPLSERPRVSRWYSNESHRMPIFRLRNDRELERFVKGFDPGAADASAPTR